MPHAALLRSDFLGEGGPAAPKRCEGGSHAWPSGSNRRLVTGHSLGYVPCMTQKALVLDAIKELPDEATLEEIAERIEFLAAIQKGIDQLDRGEGISHEEVKRQLAQWLAS